MLAKILIVGCLLAVANAEVGSNCTRDTDCETTEFCRLIEEDEAPEERDEESPFYPRAGAEEEEREEEEPEGECVEKFGLYEYCETDNQCETDVCVTGVVPGVPAFPHGMGQCVECESDSDCSGQTYCDHPVINAQCLESLVYGVSLRTEQQKQKKQQQQQAGGEYDEGRGGRAGRFGGDKSYGQSSQPHQQPSGQGPFSQGGPLAFTQFTPGSQGSGGGIASSQAAAENPLLHLLQLISVTGPEQKQETGETQDTSAQYRSGATYDARQARYQYPSFPATGRRQKRDLSHYFINKPGLTCKPRKPTNSPCRRSYECQSEKCSIEGACLS